MINLSGKTEAEIKIEFTGLRKGEKLSEKLHFNDEIMSKTEIDGILFTDNELYRVDVSNGSLVSLILKNNIDVSIKKFREMLPEYQINEEN